MKKYIVSIGMLLATVAVVSAASIALSVMPNTTNTLVTGSAKVTQLMLSAGGNTTVSFVDAPTTNLTYVVSAYTNSVSYATNIVYTYTNYWGAVTTLTNLQLVDTTSLVAASTNSYATRAALSALASTTSKADAVNYYFVNGVQLVNGAGTNIVTITYQK